MKVKEQKPAGISRRSFFKASGLAAGLAALSVAAKSSPALAGEPSDSGLINLAVREVGTPSYMLAPYGGADQLRRFDEGLTAFNNKRLSQEKFGGKPWRVACEVNVIKYIKEKVPGYSLLDQAFYDCGWTSYRATKFFSWEPLGVGNLARVQAVGKWEATPEENNRYFKKMASVYGAGATGIAAINEQWFYGKDLNGKPYIFSASHDKPTVAEDAYYIPKSMKSVIVMLAPMNPNVLKYGPAALSEGTVGTGYSLMAELASKIAEVIRALGYNAIPMGNDTALSVPMAIDAGLGELGRHGLLINPEFGSSVRIAKVLTDLPIAPDKPIKFGAAEFCRTCMKCAKACPSQSISLDKDPSEKVTCQSNNPGMKKWYVNTWTCLNFWVQNAGGCPVCVGVCPYNKPKTWIHDMVKGVSATTPVLNGTFATLDDALGYGSYQRDPLEFWNSADRPKKWW